MLIFNKMPFCEMNRASSVTGKLCVVLFSKDVHVGWMGWGGIKADRGFAEVGHQSDARKKEKKRCILESQV